MNPALLNYMQQQQPMEGSPQQGNAPTNPFDVGIRRAIESARESLGMTQKQQDKALRTSMLEFANNLSQQPKQKGFWNNFAQVGKALNPALQNYDKEESIALNENNDIANQILKHQAAEQARKDRAEEQMFWRNHAENQLGEQKRSHNLMDRFRRDDLESRRNVENTAGPSANKGAHKGKGPSKEELASILGNAEQLITKLGDNAQRGRAGRIAEKFIPGGLPLNEDQATINAIGDVLRGKLFNAWGYRNQAEFEHVPSISAENPPEVNLAIIKQLQNLLLDSEENVLPEESGSMVDSLMQGQDISQNDVVMMQDPTGAQYSIPINEVEGALSDGLMIVE